VIAYGWGFIACLVGMGTWQWIGKLVLNQSNVFTFNLLNFPTFSRKRSPPLRVALLHEREFAAFAV
jgi:hypothetical protein